MGSSHPRRVRLSFLSRRVYYQPTLVPQGPQVLAEVIGCKHDDLEIGMDVEMTLQAVPAESGGPDKAVYKWRPA